MIVKFEKEEPKIEQSEGYVHPATIPRKKKNKPNGMILRKVYGSTGSVKEIPKADKLVLF